MKGGVSPTVRDRGKCKWPNAHSPAPPSPKACRERVWGGQVYTHIKNRHTFSHSQVEFMRERRQKQKSTVITFVRRQNSPGSWRSSARYPRQPPLVAKGPTEPLLSFLLSSDREGVRIVKQICYQPLHFFLLTDMFGFCWTEPWKTSILEYTQWLQAQQQTICFVFVQLWSTSCQWSIFTIETLVNIFMAPRQRQLELQALCFRASCPILNECNIPVPARYSCL